MSSSLVSIIVPVYNVEQFLLQCLDSILLQSYQKFELLLIDDGSTDGSGGICDDYSRRDPRIRVVHKKNGGVSSARNLGLTYASGEWALFVDADDWLDEDYLLSFLSQTDLQKDILFFQGYKKIFSDKIVEFPLFSRTTSPRTIAKNNLFLYWGVWGKLFHRDTVEHLSLRFDESLALGEDTIFFFQYLAGVQEIRVLTQTGYNYRDTGSSLSKKTTPWEIHHAGSVAIYEAARPQVERFLKGAFFYRRRFLNLLVYEQHALRLGTLYSGNYSGQERMILLRETFGRRGHLLKTAYPLFSRKWKYSMLWFMFLLFPISACDWILRRILTTDSTDRKG